MDTCLRYAIENTVLSSLLLVASPRGVHLVRFGRDRAELLEQLQREFPRATVRQARDELRPWMRALLCTLEGRPPRIPVPLDVQGSRFQRRVWYALCEIPAGETRSYQDLARALDVPRAARAVGRACATNPVPVLVPCHRVIRSDGSLGGYLGGLARKRALLKREKPTTLRADLREEDPA